MQFGFTPYDSLNLQIMLWNANKYDSFFLKDGEPVEFPKARLAFEKGKDNKIKTLVYGGAAGGGKSHTIATFLLFQSCAIPGLRSFITRKELKQLRNSTVVTFNNLKSIYNLPDDIFNFNATEGIIKFYNGSEILLLATAYEPTDPLYDRFGSMEFSYGWHEEAQETPHKAYSVLKIRIGRQFHLYSQIGYSINKQFITLNPKKNWVYNLFYVPWKDGNLKSDRMFIRALAHENPFSTPEYLQELDELEDPILKARLRDGEWEYEERIDALFLHDNIMRMFDGNSTRDSNSYYITCDPARKGKDEAIIYVWRGYTIIEVHIAAKCKTTEIEDRIGQIQKKYKIPNQNVIIDSNGLGGGVNDHIEDSFEYVGSTLPIVTFRGNKSERSNKDNESMFKSLRDQCYWTASDKCNAGIPIFATNLIIEKFGDYTKSYTRTMIRDEIKAELEVVAKINKEEDKKIRVTPKYVIQDTIGKSPNFSDCFIMRFVTDADSFTKRERYFAVGIVPQDENEENSLYRTLQEIA